MRVFIESAVGDVRFAVRLLASRPAWSLAAILCLAIATGANTAAFTVVNGLLLRPLPFDDAERLVMVALRDPKRTSARPFALREYRDLAARSGSVGTFIARTFFPVSVATKDGARMAEAELVSGNYFETLRVAPFRGHFFDASADRTGAPAVAVLSYRLWRAHFDASPRAVGAYIRINSRPVMVIGVGAPEFVGATQLVAADLWLPAATYHGLTGSAASETVPMFGVIGRLSLDMTIDRAQARLTAIEAAVGQQREADTAPVIAVTPATGFGVPVAIEGSVVTLAGFVYAVMILLMVVASANVAALVLARGTGRTREIAVRLSLGASRGRLARQLLTESCVLAIVGCALGAVAALALTHALVAQLTTPFQYVRYAIDVRPDTRVLVCAAATTAMAAVLCGIAPIRYSRRVDLVSIVNRSSASPGGAQSKRTLNTIVVVQFAVSATLLAVAGTLIAGYRKAALARPGFETRNVIETTLDLNQLRLDEGGGIRLYRDLLDRLSRLPGVADVSLTRDLPLTSGRMALVKADHPIGSSPATPIAVADMVVSRLYFETLGVAVRQGRGFRDIESSRPLVAVVNETMAERLWPAVVPIGRTFRTADWNEPVEVVGIVPDMRERSFREARQPAFYQPFTQAYSGQMTVLMRVQGGDPERRFRQVRQIVETENRDLAIVDLRTLDQFIGAIVEQRRAPAEALVVLGLLGLLMTALGLGGVMAFTVRERVHELGIRLALGARPSNVRWMALRQGLTIAALGLAVGTAAALIVTRLVQRTLFGVEPLRATTIVEVGAVLLVTALAALYIPARWAAAVAPAVTLRTE